MRLLLIFFILFPAWHAAAQQVNYDSMREVLRQDSIEYQQQLKDANRIRRETDSILKNDIGNTHRIGPAPDSAEVIKGLRELALRELQQQQAGAEKRFYLIAGSFAVLLVLLLIVFKRRQLGTQHNKKP